MSTVDLSPYAVSPPDGDLEVGVCDYRFPHAVKAGWHLFRLKDVSSISLRPKIKFDWGDGQAEASVCPLGLSDAGTYEVLVRMARSAVGVRLSAGISGHSLEFARFAYTPVSRIGAASHVMGLAARAALSWPPGQCLLAVKSRPQPDGTKLWLVHPFRAAGLGSKTAKRRRNDYARWIREHDYDHGKHERGLRAELEGLASKPLFSVLMPVFDTPPELLERAIGSVQAQVYENWELCIADDRSGRAHVRQTLERRSAQDKR